MKILLLTDYYPPESNAPALRCSYHAEQWASRGHDVNVLTCALIFLMASFTRFQQQPFLTKHCERSQSHAMLVFHCQNDGYVKRALDHISSALMFSIVPLFIKRPDVIVATSPQFLTLISGYVASRILNRPLVSEIRDMWPEGIIFLSRTSIIRS